jgi:hypothetical protein
VRALHLPGVVCLGEGKVEMCSLVFCFYLTYMR